MRDPNHLHRIDRAAPRPGKRAWRFELGRRGSVAIEFAAVAIPFTLMLAGTIELGISAATGAILDGAAREASRQIRTGQAQDSGDAQGTFRNRLCSELSGMIDCNDVIMDVRSFGSFGAVSVPPLYDENGNPNSTAFQPGDAGEIVIVRTSLRWTYHTPLLSHAMGSATRELTSVQVFRNEPFRGPI